MNALFKKQKEDMNGSFAVIYVNINKSIRVHSRKKFLKDGSVIFFFIFNDEKKPEEQAFISSGILSKKDASRLSEYFKTY